MFQVDSSVGGKTAINHRLGKNMMGTFYQPQCVIIDTETLNTLPDRELGSGLGEVIKYGLVVDPQFFKWQENNMQALMSRYKFEMLSIKLFRYDILIIGLQGPRRYCICYQVLL